MTKLHVKRAEASCCATRFLLKIGHQIIFNFVVALVAFHVIIDFLKRLPKVIIGEV